MADFTIIRNRLIAEQTVDLLDIEHFILIPRKRQSRLPLTWQNDGSV